MANSITCCYKCPDREVGCHSTCDEYLSQKQANEELRRRERKDREAAEYRLNTNGTQWTHKRNRKKR